MMLKPEMLDALRGIVGIEGVVTDAESIQHASRDSSFRTKKLARRGKLISEGDVVVVPRTEEEIAQVLKWCTENNVPAVPRGPGSAVVGSGIPKKGGVLIDVRHFNQVIEIDAQNGLARVQGGILLSDLETALNEQGLTGGHYPQSLYVAGVAGSLAMRGSGTFSSLYGNVEDRLADLRVVLPTGDILQTHYAPRASAGPDLRPLFVGSEGTFGIITDVTLKCPALPPDRLFESYNFSDFEPALDTAREMLRVGVVPAVLRIYDPIESAAKHAQFASPDGNWLMVLLFEGESRLVRAQSDIVAGIAQARGGTPLGDEPARAWEQKRFDVSWFDDQVVQEGGVAEAVEVAASWSALPQLFEKMKAAASNTMSAVMGHVSHIYRDGASLYVISSGKYDTDEQALEAYDQLWKDLMEVVVAEGCVISHHHGIGTERAPWLKEQIGTVGVDVLRGIQKFLDPAGIMNPGTLGLVE